MPLEDAEYQFIASPTVGVAEIATVPVPQRDALPAVGDEGKAFTVNELLTELLQVPLLYVYFTETVPAVNPVTTPPVVTEAVPVPAIIDHVPPDCAFVKAGVEAFAQTDVAPPLFAANTGNAFTVTNTAVLVALFVQVLS